MFPFDRAPESFDEGIVGGASSSTAADSAAGGQQRLFIGEAGELAAHGDTGASLKSELKLCGPGRGATRRPGPAGKNPRRAS